MDGTNHGTETKAEDINDLAIGRPREYKQGRKLQPGLTRKL